MKKILILVLFWVQGLEAKQLSVVDQPEGCFQKKEYPCSLRAGGGVLKFKQGSEQYQLGKEGALQFLNAKQIQLLSGTLWIEKSKDLEVVAQPNLKMILDGDFLLEKQTSSTFLLRNLNGSVVFRSPFLFAEESLPLGFQNWYGTLNAQRQVDRGVIRPIENISFLKVWNSVSDFALAEAKKRVQSYRQAWAGNVEASAQFYQEIIERRLASQVELDKQRVRQKDKALAEQKRIRQIYRQKAGFED